MIKQKILIYDDYPGSVARWKDELDSLEDVKKRFDVVGVRGRTFEETVSELERRRASARKHPGWGKANEFDTAAILILDYDLLDPKKETYLTGETVAYLARCYSRCGLIIALNQYGVNPFDLTLRGHPESFADLNLGGRQIANPGLWGGHWTGFRPWSWPLLPRALEAHKRRVKELMGHLDEPILSFLGFPEEIAKILPRSATQFIGGTKRPEETTFRDFVLGSKSMSGLRRKDRPIDEESIARIAAARVARWLERLVLPGQDILVDAPHLVSRYPSLLKGDRKKVESWNKTASFQEASGLGIDHRTIEAFRFKQSNWLSRPVWFWHGLSNLEKIVEVANPWASDRPNYVFCEDLSRFLTHEAAREFIADLPSPFVRRFIVDPKSKEGRPFAKAVKGVDYRPLVRFSL
jgi:hypothetical protein